MEENRRIFDLHTHIIPGVDDGSVDMNMSLQLLRLEIAEGCHDIFLTSHSWGETELYKSRFKALQYQVKKAGLAVNLYTGMEIECADEEAESIVEELVRGNYRTLAGTQYILIEFSPSWSTKNEVYEKLPVFLNEGYKPVIAHVERYRGWSTLDEVRKWKEMGALIQVNYYSLVEEPDPAIRSRAVELVQNKIADFMGSDCHWTFHRPPRLKSGIHYIESLEDKEYAERLLCGNARKIIKDRNKGARV